MDFEFINDPEGWSFHTLPVFTPPVPRYNSTPTGSIELTATDNVSNFGYWESPVFQLVVPPSVVLPGSIPLEVPVIDGTNLYAAEYVMLGDAPERRLVPEIRLRTTAENSQQADVIVIDSINPGGISPYAGGRTAAKLYFMPPAGSPDFRFEFDMLNFNLLNDSGSATVGLDSVSICSIAALPQAVTEAEYTFDSSNEGWTTEGPQVFQAPSFGYDPSAGRLNITAVPSGSRFEFGYWGSPETGTLVHPVDGRLYFAEFTVESDQVDQALVPNFRVRINDSRFRAAQYVQVSSTGTAFNSPTIGNPKTYTVFYPPNVGTDGAFLIYSFDLVTQDSDGDANTATVSLTKLRIRSVPIPQALRNVGTCVPTF